jgi:hypothetical protein
MSTLDYLEQQQKPLTTCGRCILVSSCVAQWCGSLSCWKYYLYTSAFIVRHTVTLCHTCINVSDSIRSTNRLVSFNTSTLDGTDARYQTEAGKSEKQVGLETELNHSWHHLRKKQDWLRPVSRLFWAADLLFLLKLQNC